MTSAPKPAYPVYETQMMLRTLSKSGEDIPLLLPDGHCGAETTKAVRSFQHCHHLPETGTVDAETWECLRSEAQLASVRLSPAAPLQIILQPKQVICSGQENLHLYLVQTMLCAIGKRLSGVPEPPLTGRLDSQTHDALCWLQRCCRMEETGELDHLLWLYLTLLYRAAAQDGT